MSDPLIRPNQITSMLAICCVLPEDHHPQWLVCAV